MPLEIEADDLDRLLTMLADPGPGRNYPDEIAEFLERMAQLYDGRQPADAVADVPDGGRWLELELMGHRVRTGYVTEITIAGAAMLHIDLPAKVFGGEPDAWEEYAPSSLYGLSPVTEQSVRRAWESQRRAAEERAKREAEWRRTDAQRALTAGTADGDDAGSGDGEPDPEAGF